MQRGIIDTSSVCWTGLSAGKDEEGKVVQHEGKDVLINSWEFGYEKVTDYLLETINTLGLAPKDLVFCVEGKLAKAKRTMFYKNYKATRGSRPEEAYVEFNTLVEQVTEVFRAAGAAVCVQDGVEGDDIVAFMCEKLDGHKFVISNDGDLAALLSNDVTLVKSGRIVTDNPLGPFPVKYIRLYKSLVGDTSDNLKGASGFGDKAWLNFLTKYGHRGCAAVEGLIVRNELHELVDDLDSFPAFQKVLDSHESVEQCYLAAGLYPEWVNTKRQPLIFKTGEALVEPDSRFSKFKGQSDVPEMFVEKNERPALRRHVVFDTEIMGKNDPVFLFGAKDTVTGETWAFWHHRPGDMDKMAAMLARDDITWVSFNGINFDAPLISASIAGKDTKVIKQMATEIVEGNERAWQLPARFGYEPVEFDHIDLVEVAPGVRISLKTYAGRMGYPTMVDLPFHHDQDLTPEQCEVVEQYCLNDLGVTEALFNELATELELRRDMSFEYGIDLRSKSDAQVAEAVLKKMVGITARTEPSIPANVRYKAPGYIQTDNPVILDLIKRFELHHFEINPGNGSPENPEWLKEMEVRVGAGTYQCGIGGLHSTHDKALHMEADDDTLISDFDVASYYPNIMLNAGLTPRLAGNKGDAFIREYRKIYERRMEAKRVGDKKVANSLKITLNGTYGKLGNLYSTFYAPELLLGVTITGQLNLLCLIAEMEKIKGVRVLSANTDGIMVAYSKGRRESVLSVVADSAMLTGFDYEETRYKAVAMKDVNNYVAVTTDGKDKRKGLYAKTSLMKNPTMQVCSEMAVRYIKDGVLPHETIHEFKDIKDFVAIRNVKGGGVVYGGEAEVDDWIEFEPGEWIREAWDDTRATVKRKSRPKPVMVGTAPTYFGRVARWYMSTETTRPLCYARSGNKVPKTDGAKLCLTLPDALPKDLDKQWYIDETLSMLKDMGVYVEELEEEAEAC